MSDSPVLDGGKRFPEVASVRLPEGFLRRIKAAAKSEGISPRDFIRRAIAERLTRTTEPGGAPANRLAIEVMKRVQGRNLEFGDGWQEYQQAQQEAGKPARVAEYEFNFRKSLRGKPGLFDDLRQQFDTLPKGGEQAAGGGAGGSDAGAGGAVPVPRFNPSTSLRITMADAKALQGAEDTAENCSTFDQRYERTVGAMKGPLEPYSKSTTVREEIPDVRFGQANPQGVVDHIDDALGSAKGPVAKALSAARDTLFTNASGGRPRELDLSVAGLHGSREAINDLIAKAEPTAQRALMGVRERLDRALSTVPEYERARSGFEAASRNLDPFASSTAPGRIVDREQASGRHTMAPENVPGAIDAGPSQARAFNEVAPPAARQAYEGHVRTALLDAATDPRTGEVASGRIRELLRQNEDGLRQFPAVREHLEGVAFAREGREAVDRSPLGRIAGDPKVEKAIDALFPTNPLPGSSAEVGDAVRRMAAAHPRATSELVRMHMEQVFNEATQRLQSGANQAGGAKFSAVLVGNREQAASLQAAVKALPGGEQTWAGVRRLLDIFDAQGVRQGVGSGTSFNNTIQADLKAGKPIGEAGAAIATGGIKLPTRIMDKIEGWRMGQGLDEMARLFTDPKLASTFRRLATQPPNSAASFVQLATMIVGRAVRGYTSGQRPDPAAGAEREPLKLTVRPTP